LIEKGGSTVLDPVLFLEDFETMDKSVNRGKAKKQKKEKMAVSQFYDAIRISLKETEPPNRVTR
jgi:hypothetical protein